MKSFNQLLIDISEAINPQQVIPFDKETQKNLSSAEKKPTPKPQQNKGYNFMSRYIRNTSYLFPNPFSN